MELARSVGQAVEGRSLDTLEKQLALPSRQSHFTTNIAPKRLRDTQRPIGDLAFRDLEVMCAGAATSLDPRPKPEGTSGAHGLTGAAHKRFVIVTSLLFLIDPVRGEPTVHSLDRHPHDSNRRPENLQKKFLDSFALICSTSRIGGETASAVCLEQGHPTGNVLRLARNLGVPQDLVNQLQQILNDLAAVAANGE